MDGLHRIGDVDPFAGVKPLEQLEIPGMEIDYKAYWWKDVLKEVPSIQRSRFFSVLMKLQKNGVPNDALTEIALDYARRFAVVENPWAYYSQFGQASTAAKVRAVLAEHERVKEKR